MKKQTWSFWGGLVLQTITKCIRKKKRLRRRVMQLTIHLERLWLKSFRRKLLRQGLKFKKTSNKLPPLSKTMPNIARYATLMKWLQKTLPFQQATSILASLSASTDFAVSAQSSNSRNTSRAQLLTNWSVSTSSANNRFQLKRSLRSYRLEAKANW